MPALGLLTGTNENDFAGLPSLPLVNLTAESAVTEPRQFALVSRPRLVYQAAAVSARPTFGLHNDVAIYGNGGDSLDPHDNVYVDGVAVGRVIQRGPTSMAGNQIGTVICGVSALGFWDGATLRTVTIPDDYLAAKVLESQGRFIFVCSAGPSDTAQRYYWTEPLANMLDGSGDIVIDGLDFASAETSPDGLLDGVIWNGNLVLGGYNTIEIHAPTGNDNLPWQALVGSVINSGLLATGAMTLWNDGFAWVDHQYGVYYSRGGEATRVSDRGVEAYLKTYTRGLILDSFKLGGKEYLRARPQPRYGDFSAIDLPHMLLDSESGEWTKWSSEGGAFFGGPVRTSDFENDDYFPLTFGSIEEGRIIGFEEASEDWAEDPLVYEFRAGIPIDGGTVNIHNVSLRCTTNDAGTISLRFSRDGGASWSAWRDITLTGRVRQKVEWRSLGMADGPGFLCDFKTADIGDFYISGANFNEFVQGRSR